MKFKKLASLLIAGVMVFSMAVPAFADVIGGGTTTGGTTTGGTTTGGTTTGGTTTGGTTTGGTTTGDELANNPSDLARSLKFAGTTSVPTINVDMATDAAIILNPYGLKVKVNNEDKTDPVLTETVIISNKSNCPIDVSGSFTPSVAGDAKLVATAKAADSGTQAKPADKNVFLAVVMGNVASADAKVDFAASVTGTYREKMNKATAIASYGTFATGGQKGMYLLKTADTAVNFGDSSDSNTTKKPYTLDAGDETPTCLGMRVFGLCEQWVSNAWTTADTVSVAMAMTIVPTSN